MRATCSRISAQLAASEGRAVMTAHIQAATIRPSAARNDIRCIPSPPRPPMSARQITRVNACGSHRPRLLELAVLGGAQVPRRGEAVGETAVAPGALVFVALGGGQRALAVGQA